MPWHESRLQPRFIRRNIVRHESRPPPFTENQILGGSCKNCGSVEHYAKDCPTNQTLEAIEHNSKGISKFKPKDNI